jgi:alkaline phosphatase D
MKHYFIIFLVFLSLNIDAQIKSGPMLGYNTMREVAVWVQTENTSTVTMTYHVKDNLELNSCAQKTLEENAYTARLIAKNLEPGTSYQYEITIDSKIDNPITGEFTTQPLWQHRTDPPDFSFATGSCAYTNEPKYDRPGEPYGKGKGIYNVIADKNPSLMMWLGDNIYLREPDWTSISGINHRYTHFKSLPEIQKLWKTTHHYAIWDDHDFGPNDADRSFVNKKLTLTAFKNFWANQSYGVNDETGITSQFSFNDADFFLLDNRYNRSPNKRKTGKREILGKKQIEWLIDALVNSKASYKFVAIGGQFLSPAAVHENHATFAKERQKIIDFINDENIKNVIFLTGDRHKTELTKLVTKKGLVIYDYTCSPLASTAYNTNEEGNILRVSGTHVDTQNFGFLSLSGKFKERKLSIKTYDSKGTLVWERMIFKQ